MDSLSTQLSQLHLAEKSAVTISAVEPEYYLHLSSQNCSDCEDSRLAVTSSNFTVRLYSRHNLAHVGTIAGHDKVLSGVQFTHDSKNHLYTCSWDGTVKGWDFRTNMEKPAQVFEGYEETLNVFHSFDVSCNDKILCAGTEAKKGESNLIFWDARKSEALGVYSDSHQDDVTQVQFHPTDEDRLATGSTDGLINVFDISETSEDDALQCTFNTESSVSQIGWCGPSHNNVYGLTHIETFHVWETAESDILTEVDEVKTMFESDILTEVDEVKTMFESDILTEVDEVKTMFEGAKHVDYLVDCFQAVGMDNPFLVAGTHSGCAQILTIDGNTLYHVTSLDGGHNDDIRCITWDSNTNTLVTGGDDSMLCLWKPGDVELKGQAKDTLKVKADKKTKLKGKKSPRGSGSKPY